MSRVRISRCGVAVVLVVASTAWHGRMRGETGPGSSDGTRRSRSTPAADNADPPDCRHQCSLDGRSIIDTCTDNVVETCLPDHVCGGGVCSRRVRPPLPIVTRTAASSMFRRLSFRQHRPAISVLFRHVRRQYLDRNPPISLELEGKTLDVSKRFFARLRAARS